MMKKWVFSLFLLFVFVSSIAFADTVSGDWQYILNDSGRAVITKYLGSARDVTVPWNLDGHIVIEVGEEAFAGNTRVCSVKMPAGIICIRMNAFMGCSALEEVTLPTMLETIEDGAFAECHALTVVEIPDSVMEMGEAVFSLQTALDGSANSLAPDYARACGLQYLGSAEQAAPAAENPANNYQYVVVGGVAKITSYVGAEYNVVVPAELDGYPVRIIGTNAFSYHYEIETVILPEGLEEIETTAFIKCTRMRYIELPTTLKYIRDNAFRYCENLEDITIHDGLLELGDRAFHGCGQLRHVTIYASLPAIRTYTFYECHSSLTIHAPKGSVAERHARSRQYRFEAIEE